MEGAGDDGGGGELDGLSPWSCSIRARSNPHITGVRGSLFVPLVMRIVSKMAAASSELASPPRLSTNVTIAAKSDVVCGTLESKPKNARRCGGGLPVNVRGPASNDAASWHVADASADEEASAPASADEEASAPASADEEASAPACADEEDSV